MKILLTRPLSQAAIWQQALIAQGMEVVLLPVIEIKSLALGAEQKKNIDRLSQYDWAIFTSVNAVSFAMDQLTQPWPDAVKIIAIGEATKKALLVRQQVVSLSPEQFNSETLLSLSELQSIKHKKIVLFKGQGGRDLLTNTLQARGALVTEIMVYRRICPHYSDDTISQLSQPSAFDVTIITSVDGLDNLFKLFAKFTQSTLVNKPMIVLSKRIAKAANAYGVKSIIIVKEINITAIINILKNNIFE